MPTYTVMGAFVKKQIPDGKYGPMKVIRLQLSDGTETPKIAEWYTKEKTEVPEVGSSLDGTLEEGDYGLSFKKAAPPGGFGGGGGRDTPETRRSIAMQHAQKCAVTILEVAAAHGDYTPPDANDVVRHVTTVAAALFHQVQQAEGGSV